MSVAASIEQAPLTFHAGRKGEGRLLIWLSGPCGFCGREAHLFINRAGASRCAACDLKEAHP